MSPNEPMLHTRCRRPRRTARNAEGPVLEHSEATRTLIQLGFSETEALVYCDLLSEPGRTGYAVAKSIKKSQANVYSALAALTSKGAVSFANGDVRSYQAIPAAELLPRLGRQYEQQCQAAKAALSQIVGHRSDDSMYQLKHLDQVYERAAVMCARAADSIAFELFPVPFSRLRDSLAAAVERGVGVAGVSFDPADTIPGATCALSVKFGVKTAWPRAPAWPRDHMAIVVDAREALVALFDRDTHEVLHGLYTDSVYISCLLHASVVDGVILNLERPKVLRESLNKRLFGTVPRGFLELIST